MHKKYTLKNRCKPTLKTKVFKRVFFSPTQEEIQIIFFPTLRFFNYLFFQRTMRNRTDIALNVNRFEQSVCRHWTTPLRIEQSGDTHNISLNEILKMGALTVKRTVVHLSNSCGYSNSHASKTPFLKHR
jgi:hypothetical protein